LLGNLAFCFELYCVCKLFFGSLNHLNANPFDLSWSKVHA
jgi:hypothetical protein